MRAPLLIIFKVQPSASLGLDIYYLASYPSGCDFCHTLKVGIDSINYTYAYLSCRSFSLDSDTH